VPGTESARDFAACSLGPVSTHFNLLRQAIAIQDRRDDQRKSRGTSAYLGWALAYAKVTAL
jgi:hypothetical protein